jgi:phosphate acyltransferase
MFKTSGKIRIAIDAMGGDNAPDEIIKGSILAAQREENIEVILVGPIDILEKKWAAHGFPKNLAIRFANSKDYITESDSPVSVIRNKSNSSISVAAKMLKNGEADAVVGAGYSGAVAVSAIQYVGMLEGMERPAIIAPLSSFAHNTLLLDAGANVDCKPHQLLAFGIVGSICARSMFGIHAPTVGLLSTGSESSKGNEAVREAHLLFKNSNLNFIGNVEGNDILGGQANVVICDGYIGNVILKFYESIPGYAQIWIKKKLSKYPLLRNTVSPIFHKLFPMARKSYESEDEVSGILWGIDGVVKIAHGASYASHINHAIMSARNAVQADIVGCLRSELIKYKADGKL